MSKFKIHAVREAKEAFENYPAIDYDEKDWVITAPSCSEAVVLAHKQHPDYLVVKWEEILEPSSEKTVKRVKLDKTSFKNEVEWQSAQMTMDQMDYHDAMKLVEKWDWKLAKETE